MNCKQVEMRDSDAITTDEERLVLTDNGFLTTRAESQRKKAVRSTDTKPEVLLRKALWRRGLRYRKHLRTLPGRPDIVFVRSKVAVFVDGDFWHGRNWDRQRRRLKRNRDYWIDKIERNMERDRKVVVELQASGWKVVRTWSSDVQRDVESLATVIEEAVRSVGAENARD